MPTNTNRPHVRANPLLDTTPLSRPVRLLNTAEIKLRSGANGMVKLIVVTQSTCFILNCIFRGAHGLPLAPLEILTLTTLACSLSAYCLWWYKPYAVLYSTQLDLKLSDDQWEILKNMANNKTWLNHADFHVDLNRHRFTLIIVYLVFLLNASLHFIAWHGSFPTELEQNIWRAAAIALLVLPFLYVIFRKLASGYILTLIAISFTIIRLYVVVQSFAALRSMPAAMYDTWVSLALLLALYPCIDRIVC